MYKLKLIFLFFLLITISCNNRNKSNELKKDSVQKLQKTTCEEIYKELKKKNYLVADSLADIGIDSINSFFILMHALTEIGVDSLENAIINLNSFKLTDSSKCAQIIADRTISYLHAKGVDFRSISIYISIFIEELEFENFNNICSLMTITNETYTVTVHEKD